MVGHVLTSEGDTVETMGPEEWLRRMVVAYGKAAEGRLWERINKHCDGHYRFTREDGVRYGLTLDKGRAYCSCPASAYGNPCKHVAALRVYLRSA